LNRPLVCVAALALALTARLAASAPDAGPSAASDIAADAAIEVDAAEDQGVSALVRAAHEVRSLCSGGLDAAVDPTSLFEVSLDDEDAVRVDALRLRVLLHDVDAAPTQRRSASPRARSGTAADGPEREAGIDPRLWDARIDLDRARLSFYDLPADRRREILASHALRQADAEAAPSAEDLRERTADEQRRAALVAAKVARSDAERLVSTEFARLLAVEHAQSEFDVELARRRRATADVRDVTIGWQQRALEAWADAGSSADGTYDDLRRALRSARASLDLALDRLAGAASEVPEAGPDALPHLRVDVDTSAARKERERVETEARRLALEEQSIRRERAAALFDEIDALNHERLALLGALSPEKRRAVMGFTSVGWDQAASEGRQLTLILRYHAHIIGQRLATFRDPGRALEPVVAGGALQIFEWLLVMGVFVWWRRRSTPLLVMALGRAREDDRRARRPAPGPVTRTVQLLVQVHRPAEWLALLFVLRWLFASATQQLLEVRLPLVLLTWIFGGTLGVDVINAIAGAQRTSASTRVDRDTAALRLRSLRLVGRVVVAFGLILSIGAMLVGRGTIYDWVFSLCWFASIPILLVLVRWWRSVVFDRTEQVRRPSRIQRWVLANKHGWTSFVAACVGAANLFASGAARSARNWIGRFVITRRILAYLFRRQLGKLGGDARVVAPLSAAAFESLGPEKSSRRWIATDSDESIDRLAKRIRERRGGVIALIGERGMGKTAVLKRLRGDAGDALLVDSPLTGIDGLRDRLAEELGLPPPHEMEFEGVAAALSSSEAIHALLLDDAHRFVQPVMGGLAGFDALLAAASRHTSTTTWVFALDEVVWPFLERARGARPLFDEVLRLQPWNERSIVHLLEARTEEAALSPSFEHLLDPLPVTADEVDIQEALAQRAADYYRMLWDSATGNPGVALQMWRRSLGTDTSDKTAVRVFMPLDTTDLERLPDSTVFVLRAVLQLAPAQAEHIARGTLLRPSEVSDALRYAESRGYVEERDGGYRVTWTWFRAVTLFLQRRHLLVTR
jgi:hypothetical protein